MRLKKKKLLKYLKYLKKLVFLIKNVLILVQNIYRSFDLQKDIYIRILRITLLFKFITTAFRASQFFTSFPTFRIFFSVFPYFST